MSPKRQTRAVLLAAGGSCRLGRPKQLLDYQGKTLVEHAIATLSQTDVQRIVVVTGSKSEQLRMLLETTSESNIDWVHNDAWATGQASSLALGLSTVHQFDSKADVVVGLCDQPLIQTRHYQDLIDSVQSGIPVACTAYESGGGVPACFAGCVICEVIASLHSHGAKRWIRKQPESRIRRIACEQSLIDIDTEADYRSVLAASGNSEDSQKSPQFEPR